MPITDADLRDELMAAAAGAASDRAAGFLAFASAINGAIGAGGSLGAVPTTLAAFNGDVVNLVICQPVFLSGEDTVQQARAGSQARAQVIGLVLLGATPTNWGSVLIEGLLVATTSQWDAVTGQAGGLTPGVEYFLDTTAGKMTAAAPTALGNSVVRIGRALDPTTMDVDVSRPILL